MFEEGFMFLVSFCVWFWEWFYEGGIVVGLMGGVIITLMEQDGLCGFIGGGGFMRGGAIVAGV